MNKIKLIGLAAIFATTAASAANVPITFPQGKTSANVPITFPQGKTPIALVGGYQVEGGILTSSTYNCDINISDLEIEAKLQWDGSTPQILIVGKKLSICRFPVTGPFSIDLSEYIHRASPHILDRLEVVNRVDLGL